MANDIDHAAAHLLLSRRRWLQAALFGSGLLGLRAAASGIPPAVLASPRTALLGLNDDEAMQRIDATRAQFLVQSISDLGEPMNCNAPGLYSDPEIRHPTDPSMAPVTFGLGGQSTTAAAVWATLPPAVLARSCFFHHGTFSFAHGDLPSIYRLQGVVPNQEQLQAALAKPLHDMLGTIQAQPINISGIGNAIEFRGVQQPTFRPTAIKNFLSAPASQAALGKASSLRDRDLDALGALVRSSGTKAQQQLLDAWATSQSQARMLSQDVVGQLGSISGDSITDQMNCAALLCALKLAPVYTVSINFGGDNHTDNDPHQGKGGLPAEQGQHVTGVAAIGTLMAKLAALGIADNVTFSTLTTFGRTNCDANYTGRTHNGTHTTNLILGKNNRGSVIGGVKLMADKKNLMAQGIDSQSGQASDGGDIPYKATLASFGATLGASLGLDAATLTTSLGSSQVVQAALA